MTGKENLIYLGARVPESLKRQLLAKLAAKGMKVQEWLRSQIEKAVK